MKNIVIAAVAGITLVVGGTFGGIASGAEQTGEALFKQHCALCHTNGGNIVNSQKTLHKKDREKNGIKTAADIIKTMRNPGPGMTKFDGKVVSDKDAGAIAGYIVKTF